MIAQTIFQQIGGRRFATMTGSHDFTNMGNGLRMSLARNKTIANRLDIIYEAGADLYNMRFYRKILVKRPLRAGLKILPRTKASVAICWRICSLWRQDFTHISEW